MARTELGKLGNELADTKRDLDILADEYKLKIKPLKEREKKLRKEVTDGMDRIKLKRMTNTGQGRYTIVCYPKKVPPKITNDWLEQMFAAYLKQSSGRPKTPDSFLKHYGQFRAEGATVHPCLRISPYKAASDVKKRVAKRKPASLTATSIASVKKQKLVPDSNRAAEMDALDPEAIPKNLELNFADPDL